MAVTATATILTSAASLPIGFVPPTLTPVTAVEEGEYTVDLPISLADPATPTTGLNAVIGAAEADFETVQAITQKLDVSQTITVNLTIRSCVRLNTAGTSDGNIFIDGTEVYRTFITFEYE